MMILIDADSADMIDIDESKRFIIHENTVEMNIERGVFQFTFDATKVHPATPGE